MSGTIDRDERIGERLLRFKIIDTYHLNNVLLRQRHGDKRCFGDIAVDLGYVGKNALESCVQTKGLDLYEKQGKSQNGKKNIRVSYNEKKAE